MHKKALAVSQCDSGLSMSLPTTLHTLPAMPCRCRRTVQQLLHAFRRLGSVLRGVLAPGVLVEVAAQLVQRVCTRIIGGWQMVFLFVCRLGEKWLQ